MTFSNNGIIALDVDLFERCMASALSDKMKTCVLDEALSFRVIDTNELEHTVIEMLKVIDRPLKRSGPDRIDDWARGWAENRDKYSSTHDVKQLVPGYVNSSYLRVLQKLVEPDSNDFEAGVHRLVVDAVADEFMHDAVTIYEFGCGTGVNLIELNKMCPTARLTGADWVDPPGLIIEQMADDLHMQCSFRRFDIFNPDHDFALGRSAAVLTVTALEQIGRMFEPFIVYLLRQRPSICVHVEPIVEHLKPDECMLDYITDRYADKRNYLRGLLPYLQRLEKNGVIEIVCDRRTGFGSLMNEAYSIVAWRPT